MKKSLLLIAARRAPLGIGMPMSIHTHRMLVKK